jgi:Ni,Fe-hydrogenase III large subunit
VEQLVSRLRTALTEVAGATQILWDSRSAQARFEDTCTISQDTAKVLGLVGPVARCTGLDGDVRRDFPHGIYRFALIPPSTWHTGDVFARAYVRWLEIQRSGQFVLEQLESLPIGDIRGEIKPLAPQTLTVSLVEGWRGEICHVAITDRAGALAQYKVVDPSFHNWIGMMMALRNQQISDFPLCNKSFNLSYCGHDL